MFLFNCLVIVCIVALILSTAIPTFSLVVPLDDRTDNFYVTEYHPDLVRRQNGNLNVAGDLYGLGLRVGAYLQISGMLLYCIRSRNEARSGILLLSSSVCLSLFTAWTVLVSRRSLSPCEAWIVLSLSYAYGTPRYSAINEGEESKGGIATLCCLVSVLWQQILYIWFFAVLYRELPLFETSNRVWFFVPVDLSGWFRVFMLVVTCIETLQLPFQIGAYLELARERFADWTCEEVKGSSPKGHWARFLGHVGEKARKLKENVYFKKFTNLGEHFMSRIRRRTPLAEIGNDTPLEELKRLLAAQKRDIRIMRIGLCFWGLAILILTIAGVEMTIEYNSLSPSSDLSVPGQNIPFTLGIITFLIGAAHAIKPASEESNNTSSTDSQPSLTDSCLPHRDEFDSAVLAYMKEQDKTSMFAMTEEKAKMSVKDGKVSVPTVTEEKPI